jgi:uncharacterized protein (DUF2225 family)
LTTTRKAAIHCPCCEKKFDTEIVVSTIWTGEVSTDLLRFAWGKMPINYLVHTCPACGWSGQEENPDQVPLHVSQFVKESITPKLGRRGVPSWRRWEFHARIQEAAGACELELGAAFLIAAQCARLDERFEEERIYRLESIGHYGKALEKGEVHDDALYQTTYLMGELHRRVGNTWEARKWFQEVLDLDLDHKRREFFVDLARQQMTDPRRFIDEESGDEFRKRERPSLWSRLKGLLGRKPIRY